MLSNAVIQIGFYSLVVTLISVPLGLDLACVFAGERTFMDPVLLPVERLIYRLCGVHPATEQTWVEYTISVLLFSVVGMVVLYALERSQFFLPLNPQGFAGVEPGLAFNTAASFTTNTNWQAYSGQLTMSYLTQMAGSAFHNFVSAAAGLAIAIAVIRGFVRRSGRTLGNFWNHLVRSTLWVLLPICINILLGPGLAGRARIISVPTPRSKRSKRGRRPLHRDRWRRRLRSSSWVPMVAASSTPTLPIRSRIRHHLRTFSRYLPFLRLVPVCRTPSERWPATGARDGRSIRRWGCCSLVPWSSVRGPSSRVTRNLPPWASIRPRMSSKAAATWKARRCVSGSSIRRSGPPPQPTPPTGPLTRCMTASPRWADWCRCLIFTSEKWCSAGWVPDWRG